MQQKARPWLTGLFPCPVTIDQAFCNLAVLRNQRACMEHWSENSNHPYHSGPISSSRRSYLQKRSFSQSMSVRLSQNQARCKRTKLMLCSPIRDIEWNLLRFLGSLIA